MEKIEDWSYSKILCIAMLISIFASVVFQGVMYTTSEIEIHTSVISDIKSVNLLVLEDGTILFVSNFKKHNLKIGTKYKITIRKYTFSFLRDAIINAEIVNEMK